MDLGLTDRVYLVTGGTRGLGRAAARALVADGARVVLSARDQDGASAAASDLEPGCAIGLGVDNADADTAGRLVAAALRRYGHPEEFGRVAAFLLSPASSYVTGTMLAVDGGALRVRRRGQRTVASRSACRSNCVR